MTVLKTTIAPTEINLHRKPRVLEIVFSDGVRFAYPCEYLRVFSPTVGAHAPVHGKKTVALTHPNALYSFASISLVINRVYYV